MVREIGTAGVPPVLGLLAFGFDAELVFEDAVDALDVFEGKAAALILVPKDAAERLVNFSGWLIDGDPLFGAVLEKAESPLPRVPAGAVVVSFAFLGAFAPFVDLVFGHWSGLEL